MKAVALDLRFWEQVPYIGAGNEECWEWTGFRIDKGYGRIRVGRTTSGAHRVAWTLVWGPIPDGLHVLHHCDNPPCVNPNHLYLGTERDNSHDSLERGRHWSKRMTTCKWGHPWIEANIIRHPNGRLRCRICARAYQRRANVAKREARAQRRNGTTS